MATNVYKYPYGSLFRFIPLGTTDKFAVAYNLDKKLIMGRLAPMIVDACPVVETIDNKVLSYELLLCLESNLGYCMMSETEAAWYINEYDQCKLLLTKTVSDLIRSHWTVQEMKDYLKHIYAESPVVRGLIDEAEQQII